MDSKKVIVIMSIYNGEHYLMKSISSVLEQTYKNFQLVLIDDCSSDSSVEICREFKQKDERIILIENHINKGNHCLLECSKDIERIDGDYVMVLDADDWMEKNMIEVMVDEIERLNVSILVCNWFENEKKQCNRIKKSKIYDNADAVDELIQDKIILSYFWNKIYDKKIFIDGLNDCQIHDRNIFDDFVYMPFFFCRADKVATITDCLYHYRIHESNYSNKTKKEKLHYDLAKSYWYRIDFLEKNYPEILQMRMEIISKAFENSLGAWRELILSHEWQFANILRQRMKQKKHYLHKINVNFQKYRILKICILRMILL